jgi:hypothetical protein
MIVGLKKPTYFTNFGILLLVSHGWHDNNTQINTITSITCGVVVDLKLVSWQGRKRQERGLRVM